MPSEPSQNFDARVLEKIYFQGGVGLHPCHRSSQCSREHPEFKVCLVYGDRTPPSPVGTNEAIVFYKSRKRMGEG